MTSGYLYAAGLSILVLWMLFSLLRRRRIREKYVGIWMLLSLAIMVFGAFPGAAFWLAATVKVQTPANLLFAAAIVVLLAVVVHLSVELSSLEERLRTVAEELALMKTRAEPSRGAASDLGGGSSPPAD
jgi:hypothetical protein